MLLSPHHRFLVNLELKFRAARDRGKAMHLIDPDQRVVDAMTTLRRAVRNKSAKISLGEHDEIELLLVKHIQQKNMLVLLFKRSDPNASIQMYSHRETRQIRRSDKKREEDVAYSAHLFVSCQNSGTEDAPKYNALLEEVHGIARGHILDLIGKILREAPYDYENDRGEEKQTHTIAEAVGVANTTLQKSIEGSRIPRITLIRAAQTDGLDVEGQAFPREQRMPISLKATPDPLPLLKRIQKWGRENGWTDFRIDIEMPENRSRTIAMTREDEAASVLFTRSIPVNLMRPIELCTHQINDELVEHAFQHL